MRYFLMLGIVALLVGCANSHKLLRTGNSLTKLDSSKSFYIAVPRDGRYGKIDYKGSGANTAQIILMALAGYTNSVETGHQYQLLKDALIYAKESKYDYLIFPTILEWEDRATEWSGIPDKASIKISIIDVASDKNLDSVIIRGKSGIATFGGDHPQDLLSKPVNEYFHILF